MMMNARKTARMKTPTAHIFICIYKIFNNLFIAYNSFIELIRPVNNHQLRTIWNSEFICNGVDGVESKIFDDGQNSLGLHIYFLSAWTSN